MKSLENRIRYPKKTWPDLKFPFISRVGAGTYGIIYSNSAFVMKNGEAADKSASLPCQSRIACLMTKQAISEIIYLIFIFHSS
jgi:hypothetical protein